MDRRWTGSTRCQGGETFKWIGKGEIKKGRLKNQLFYQCAQFGEVRFGVGDFVFIKNGPDEGFTNSFIAEIEQLYDSGDGGEVSHRAVVAWYWRRFELPSKIQTQLHQSAELVLNTGRLFGKDIDAETIIGTCQVTLLTEDEPVKDLFSEDSKCFFVKKCFSGRDIRYLVPKELLTDSLEIVTQGTPNRLSHTLKSLKKAKTECKSLLLHVNMSPMQKGKNVDEDILTRDYSRNSVVSITPQRDSKCCAVLCATPSYKNDTPSNKKERKTPGNKGSTKPNAKTTLGSGKKIDLKSPKSHSSFCGYDVADFLLDDDISDTVSEIRSEISETPSERSGTRPGRSAAKCAAENSRKRANTSAAQSAKKKKVPTATLR